MLFQSASSIRHKKVFILVLRCEVLVLVLNGDVKLEFFSKSKLKSKKSIKTRNSFPVRTGRVGVAEHAKPRLWWSAAEGSEPTPAKSVRHVGQGTLACDC